MIDCKLELVVVPTLIINKGNITIKFPFDIANFFI